MNDFSNSISVVELLKGIDHGLLGPLNTIVTRADFILLDQQRTLDDQTRQDARDIATAAQELNDMLKGLLDSLRMLASTIRVQPTDIALPIGDAIKQLRHGFADNQYRVEAAIPDGLPAIQIDSPAVQYATQTLLTHVCRFAHQDRIQLWVQESNSRLVVSVGEEKCPLDEVAELPRERKNGLLGVDLLVCQHLIALHGGSLWATEASGREVCLHFDLPLN